jgi:decaprenylphospho-beta-D-ribofuranose 2-oxidase
LLLPDGSRVPCSQTENAELFAATIGGMGLTGTILTASFSLRRVETAWMRQQTAVAANLAEALTQLGDSDSASYSVAWIDCLARGSRLGRGLVYRGEHASRSDLDRLGPGRPAFPSRPRGRLAIPFDFPSSTLNRLSVSAFNALYYRRGAARAGTDALMSWDAYFFPLDGLANWNRLYGSRGFVQHQCVIPPAKAHAVLAEILERVARLGLASPLAVLKQLRPGHGLMSFPLEGYTLALDLPAKTEVFDLLDSIDKLVMASGGRIYLAKDARQSRATFEAGYPALASFRDMRRAIGADGRIASRLSTRLGLS